MRTKQQRIDLQGVTEMRDLIAVFARTRVTLLQDAAGVLSLMALLVIGLNLPDLI